MCLPGKFSELSLPAIPEAGGPGQHGAAAEDREGTGSWASVSSAFP